LSATERSSGQLSPLQSSESHRIRLDRSGWGPGGRRFKSCLPDRESPANCNSRFAGALVWGPIIGPILDPEQPGIVLFGSPRRFLTCDRTIPSRVVAGLLRPKSAPHAVAPRRQSRVRRVPHLIGSWPERCMRVPVSSAASVWHAGDQTTAPRLERASDQARRRRPLRREAAARRSLGLIRGRRSVAWIRAVSGSLLPFHGCRSGTGYDRAPADCRRSSQAGVWSWRAKMLACVSGGQRMRGRSCLASSARFSRRALYSATAPGQDGANRHGRSTSVVRSLRRT
jgi:hypothetical protein